MSDFDPADFVDNDFQAHKAPSAPTASSPPPAAVSLVRAPTREEVDSKVLEAQQKLAELKRMQDDLERERAALEETRRRQAEFQNGRQEMIHHLTRGVGLLEEAEFNARRDAEQMSKTLADFRAALEKLASVKDESWTKDNFNVELTRALTAIENARMEWNAARLKFPLLSGEVPSAQATPASPQPALPLSGQTFGELCRIGIALTFPIAIVALAALGVFIVILLRR